MLQKLALSLALCLLHFFLSAAITVTVKGRVIDQNSQLGVANVIITLKDIKGRIFKDTTNTEGCYEFLFKKDFFVAALVYADTSIIKPPPVRVHNFDDDLGKIAVDDTLKDVVFVKDFYLKKAPVELRFPIIYFKKNSVEYANQVWEGDTIKTEITLDRVAEQIKHEKDLVVEIGARCSAEEKDVANLSLKRARKIVSDLLKRGVSKKRMVVKGYGANAPKYSETEIKEAKTEEQEAMRAQNRRCVFGILKWDEEEKK